MAKYNIRTLRQKEAIWKYYLAHGWKAVRKKYDVSRATFVHWQERVESAGPNVARPLARRYHIRPETVEYVKLLHKQNRQLTIKQIREEACKVQPISLTKVWHIISGR